MREAFREALEELEAQPGSSCKSSVALLALEAASSSPDTQRSLSSQELTRLTYRARKLGRSWSAYTHQVEASAHRLAELRDDWATLSLQFPGLTNGHRITLLGAFLDGLALADRRHFEHRRSFLRRQERGATDSFAGLSRESGLHEHSPAAYALVAIEELADVPLEERKQLHTLVTKQVSAQPELLIDRLLLLLSCWLGVRGQTDWYRICSREGS